ncbi:MAG TPA: DNA alkylation repair protein [Acidimicrobiales bacterium]|nr:DNA alkylation repair protein [Acidimicrobiales bacterium]
MPDPFVATFTGRLEVLFEERRDPSKAVGMAAYMRDRFPYFGLPAPAQRAAAREALEGLGQPTEADLVQLATTCWARPQREWQYAACDLLARRAKHCSPALLLTVEHLITTKSWWDTVDLLASKVVGTLVRNHRELAPTMDAWIDADDFWLARTAILHQLGSKSGTDADRLFAYCERRAGDTEFFVRKAIGWALREYAKTDPRAVRQFVADHDAVLSNLSKREALKNISSLGK